MSDEKDITGNEDVAEQDSASPVAGERLAEARRAQQIPLIEIAKELHLDEYKVRALENNDFDVIGAPVFAKGHLRKYAQLVDVDEADVMADYYQLDRSSAAPPLVMSRPRPRQMVSPGPWIAAMVVLLIVATAYWWFFVRAESPQPTATNVVAPLPEATVSKPIVDEVSEPQPALIEEIQDEVETAPVARQDYSSSIVDVVDDPLGTSIQITYIGDCWTEITDANGRRLFFDLGKAGRTVTLSGEAPINVLFGNAANVEVAVEGSPYPIPAANRRGRTARFTVSGS